MTKLSKDEIIAKINDKIVDNDELKVELLEDISDSFIVDNTELNEMTSKYEDMKSKYDDLHTKYIDRFMNPTDVKDIPTNDPYSENEKPVIDIREI